MPPLEDLMGRWTSELGNERASRLAGEGGGEETP